MTKEALTLIAAYPAKEQDDMQAANMRKIAVYRAGWADAKAAAVAEPVHPDDAAVDALAKAMKAKLAKQRSKGYGGWDTDCTQQRLSDMLREHVVKGDPVDVANFCAFLAARGEGIAALPTPKAEPAPAWDGKLHESLQRSLNAARLECPPELVNDLEFEVRKSFEALSTSLTMAKRMYGAARDRLDAIDAAQPDPFAARVAQPAVEPVAYGRWIERWYGSGGKEGYEGWSILNAETRALVAYMGRDVDSDVVSDIVTAHNATGAAPDALDAETVKKAQRYDWLRDFHNGPEGVQDNLPYIAAGADNDLVWALCGLDADEGIDAAITAQSAQKNGG